MNNALFVASSKGLEPDDVLCLALRRAGQTLEGKAGLVACDARRSRLAGFLCCASETGLRFFSPLVKQELTASLEARKVITVEFDLFDPVYRTIDIDADMYLWADEAEDALRARICPAQMMA